MASQYTNTRPSKVSVAGVHFLPGETKEITDEHAKALEAKHADGTPIHPLRKGHAPILARGIVAMPEAPPAPAIKGLEGLDDVKALAQVRLCGSLEILATWHATETRPEVLAAIGQRGKVISALQKA